MPIEPRKPKCKVCHRVKQEANRWFRVERVEAMGRVIGLRWSGLVAEDLLDQDADFVCGPGCLARETSEVAQVVIEGEKLLQSADAEHA